MPLRLVHTTGRSKVRGDHTMLVTAPPTLGQRQAALVVVVLQFVACAVVAPFPVDLPRIDSFVPVLLTIIFIADFITAVLLFSQTTIVASRASWSSQTAISFLP